MATLNGKVQAFIVYGFANFMKPQQIVDAVKENFGIEVSRQQVCYYNPESLTRDKDLAPKWLELFEKYRKEATEETKAIAVSHKPYRIKMLQELIEKAMKSGNMVLAADLLKQVAEEMGGKYTNQQKVDSKVEQTGEINHKHSIDLPQNIADLNAQELAKLYFAKS